jgi:hypothetical protein
MPQRRWQQLGAPSWAAKQLRATALLAKFCPLPLTLCFEWCRTCTPIVCRAVQLYSQLCSQPALQESVFGISSYREMPLVEGPLSPEDMRFLKCLADAVHCPCVLRYKQVTAGNRASSPGRPPRQVSLWQSWCAWRCGTCRAACQLAPLAIGLAV